MAEVVKWQFRNPYHNPHQEAERLFVFGSHTLVLTQQPTQHIDLRQNTGYLVWDGAYILSKFLFDHLSLRGKTCLELGAGSALVSLVAHLKGADKVTATDMKEYQPFIHENIARNIPNAEDRKAIKVCELMWGQKTSISTVDVVFGSEILYLEDTHDLLLATLQEIMHGGSVAYFIYKERGLNEHQFAEKARTRFHIKELPKSLMDMEFRDEPYHLLRLTKKAFCNS
ncbi:hypothetical protein GQ54DRAFT_14776 [Martensiomyces pterosporus]|nr:hypothetical protein GQ54DRAFT_14776 [Martensiomyces pterosporus]